MISAHNRRSGRVILSLTVCIITGLSLSQAAFAEDDLSLYREIRNLQLQSKGVRASGITIEKDAARIHLAEGDIWFFSPVKGKILGAVFIGRGEITLNATVNSEKRFLEKLTSGEPFAETFRGLMLLFADNPFQDKLLTPSTATAAKARDLAQDTWNFFRKGRKYSKPNAIAFFFPWNVPARLLFEWLNPSGAESFFLASGDGDRYGEFVYLEDPLGVPGHEPEEVVLLNLSKKNLGSWYAAHFSSHYQNGRPRDPHPRRLIEVERYWIGAQLEGRAMAALANMTFKPVEDKLSVLPLNLDASLRLTEIKDQNGKSVKFIQEKYDEDANLIVIFPSPLEKGKPCSLNFTYAGANSITDHGNGNYSLLDRSNWYPNPGLGAYKAKFGMHFNIPAKTRLLATGKKTMERQDGNRLLVTWVSDIPLKVAGFNYGIFEANESVDKVSGCRIETYANKKLPDELMEIKLLAGMIEGPSELTLLRSLNTVQLMKKVHAEAEAAVMIYSGCFGPLPYNRIAVTQQPFYSFGQAWPTLIYMPITAFLPSLQKEIMGLNDGFYTRTFYQLVCAHEVAHQWWGHWVGWSNYRDQWLSEGLAVFSSALFAQQAYGSDKMHEYLDELKDQLTQKNRRGVRPIELGGLDMGYRLDMVKTSPASQAVMYGKGGYILHMLRMMMWDPKNGDSRFFSMLKDLVTSQANGFLTTDGFQAHVEKYMTPLMKVNNNNSMTWFFDQWVRDTWLPHYSLDYQLTQSGKGSIVAKVKIRQSRVSDDFVMLVPVYAQFGDKTMRLGQVRIKGNIETPPISIPLPERPKRLLLCARRDILCELD